MTEIIFLNKNKIWHCIFKDFFKGEQYRLSSIENIQELNEWNNIEKIMVIAEELLLIDQNINYADLKKQFTNITTWKLLENKSKEIDPLIFKNEIIAILKEL